LYPLLLNIAALHCNYARLGSSGAAENEVDLAELSKKTSNNKFLSLIYW